MMDERTDKQSRFGYWFTNVYWYHYKWQTIGALLGILFLAVLIHDILSRVESDVHYYLLFPDTVQTEQIDPINQLFAQTGGDINGDGQTAYTYDIISTGMGQGSEAWKANMVKMEMSLMDEALHLFIAAESVLEESEILQTPELWTDMQALGFETPAERPYLVELTHIPMMAELGLDGEPLYAALKREPRGDSAKHRQYKQAWDGALECVRALTEWQNEPD